jgi:hypothetical protein
VAKRGKQRAKYNNIPSKCGIWVRAKTWCAVSLFQTCHVREAPKYFFLWIWWAAGRVRLSALVMAFLG